MPERIWQRRIAGWRMPLSGRSVARPGRFGNPWSVLRAPGDRLYSLAGPWSGAGRFTDKRGAAEVAVDLFERWMTGGIELDERFWQRPDVGELAGHDLACFCEPGEPCHADVLLRLANPGAATSDVTNAVSNGVTSPVTGERPYWFPGQGDGWQLALPATDDVVCGQLVEVVTGPGGPVAKLYREPAKRNVLRVLHSAAAGETVRVG